MSLQSPELLEPDESVETPEQAEQFPIVVHPSNPFYWLKMLWWLLINPAVFQGKIREDWPEHLQKLGSWLVAGLVGLPLLVLMIPGIQGALIASAPTQSTQPSNAQEPTMLPVCLIIWLVLVVLFIVLLYRADQMDNALLTFLAPAVIGGLAGFFALVILYSFVNVVGAFLMVFTTSEPVPGLLVIMGIPIIAGLLIGLSNSLMGGLSSVLAGRMLRSLIIALMITLIGSMVGVIAGSMIGIILGGGSDGNLTASGMLGGMSGGIAGAVIGSVVAVISFIVAHGRGYGLAFGLTFVIAGGLIYTGFAAVLMITFMPGIGTEPLNPAYVNPLIISAIVSAIASLLVLVGATYFMQKAIPRHINACLQHGRASWRTRLTFVLFVAILVLPVLMLLGLGLSG